MAKVVEVSGAGKGKGGLLVRSIGQQNDVRGGADRIELGDVDSVPALKVAERVDNPGVQVTRGDIGFRIGERFPGVGQVGLDLAGVMNGIEDPALAGLDLQLL